VTNREFSVDIQGIIFYFVTYFGNMRREGKYLERSVKGLVLITGLICSGNFSEIRVNLEAFLKY